LGYRSKAIIAKVAAQFGSGKAGLLAGDEIVGVNGVSTKFGMSSEVKLVHPPNQKVRTSAF